MNAYEAILEGADRARAHGDGAAISISMFSAMADWMAVPLIRCGGGQPPRRMGLAHTSIAPYGVFGPATAPTFVSIQGAPQWRRAGRAGAAATPRSPPIPPLPPTSRACCGRKRGIVRRYGMHLCRQCFREIAPQIGFKKYS